METFPSGIKGVRMCYLFLVLAVLNDWLSVPLRSAEMLLCFVSPRDSGSLPCTWSNAGIESFPGKALAGGKKLEWDSI